jgi:hypothetical protein
VLVVCGLREVVGQDEDVGGDEAAALLSAMYSYYSESGEGESVKINQMMSEDNKHSGITKQTQCVDIQYVSTNGKQGDTRKGNVDYNRSQTLVDKLRFFGFNDRPDGWNILTASGDNKSAALKGTHLYNKSEHRHHMHLQGFNKKHIK